MIQFFNKKGPFGKIFKNAVFLLSAYLKILYWFVYIKSGLHDCKEGRPVPRIVDIGPSNVS